MTNYTGPERRSDYLLLDNALEEVQKLHGSVVTLANAVVNSVPRDELESLKEEMKREYFNKMIVSAVAATLIIVFMILYMNFKFNHQRADLNKDHAVITCLLTKPETARTGEAAPTTLLLCQQSTK